MKTIKTAHACENITLCTTISSSFVKPQENTDGDLNIILKLTIIITLRMKVITRYPKHSLAFRSEDLKAQVNGRSCTSLSTPFNNQLPFAFWLTKCVTMCIVDLFLGQVTPVIAVTILRDIVMTSWSADHIGFLLLNIYLVGPTSWICVLFYIAHSGLLQLP